MARSVGRPLKYRQLLTALHDEDVYSPGKIARFGEATGILDTSISEDEVLQQRLRIRHTLARYRINHKFPREGDGMVYLRGQSPTPGWTGKRWKARLDIPN